MTTTVPHLPDVLAAAPMRPVVYALDVSGVLRLALRPEETAPLLGLSYRQTLDLCRSGRLRSLNLHPGSRNGRYLIPVGAIVEWLAGRDEPVPSTA